MFLSHNILKINIKKIYGVFRLDEKLKSISRINLNNNKVVSISKVFFKNEEAFEKMHFGYDFKYNFFKVLNLKNFYFMFYGETHLSGAISCTVKPDCEKDEPIWFFASGYK